MIVLLSWVWITNYILVWFDILYVVNKTTVLYKYPRNFGICGHNCYAMVLHGHVTGAAILTLQSFRRLEKVFEYTHFDVLVFISGLC